MLANLRLCNGPCAVRALSIVSTQRCCPTVFACVIALAEAAIVGQGPVIRHLDDPPDTASIASLEFFDNFDQAN